MLLLINPISPDAIKRMFAEKPQLEHLLGYPSVRWRQDASVWALWPLPAPNVTVLYDIEGTPRAYLVSDE